jgi:hypothetical protein
MQDYENETLKIVWAYMIVNGTLTTGKWNYHGGGWDRIHGYDWKKQDHAYKTFTEEVKTVGVNWHRTQEPQSSVNSAFTDTFHDSADVETLLGTVVLNNGKEYKVGVNHADTKFTQYMKMIAEYAANKARVKTLFGD